MPRLDERQRDRLRSLRQRYEEGIEKRKGRLRRGEVLEEKLPFAHSSMADEYRTVGITNIGLGEFEAARDAFEEAATWYRTSAREARRREGDTHTFRKPPMTLAAGVYAAALAGAVDEARSFAESIRFLDPEAEPPHDFIDEPLSFHPDKYYFAPCLAGAVLDSVDPADVDSLEEINEEKPTVDALYGEAAIRFARGVRTDDPGLVEQGIRSMLEYHERTLDEENVVALVMAPEATGLLAIARHLGYDVEIESGFVPERFVEASTGGDE